MSKPIPPNGGIYFLSLVFIVDCAIQHLSMQVFIDNGCDFSIRTLNDLCEICEVIGRYDPDDDVYRD